MKRQNNEPIAIFGKIIYRRAWKRYKINNKESKGSSSSATASTKKVTKAKPEGNPSKKKSNTKRKSTS